nr:reverse transcriptase domain-containing protein [Tanacetum cinerariifolium]
MIKKEKSEKLGSVPTEKELILEHTQQGISHEVSVSTEGVEELKRNDKIKGVKKEALLIHLGRNRVNTYAIKNTKVLFARLQKWSIMLGEHNITYRTRTSVKGQILADFLIKMSGDASQAVPAAATREEPWMLFIDGSLCVDGSGAGLILTNPEGVEFTYTLKFQFTASNNEAEYEALVAGLRIAMQMGVKNVQVNVDSKMVANQVLGTYVSKEDNVIKYLEIVQGLISGFTTFSISQVPRSKNKKADALSKIASTSFAHLTKHVLVEVIENKSIKGKEVKAVIEEEGPTWMTQLVDYLKEGILPGDEKEARKIRLNAHQYELMEWVLYRRSFLTPWLRCVGPLQADYVMREIHEGSCSMHAGPRSVVAKAMRLGPLSERAEEGQVFDCRHGLLHEVDKSKGGGNDYRRAGKEIRMGQYCMPLCNDASHAIAGGKLGPKWEGPYKVTEALGNETYKPRSTDGTMLPRTWNVTNLKRCYL